MSPLLRLALTRLSLFLFIGLLVGRELDNWLLGVAIALATYVVAIFINYARFQRWIDGGLTEKRPLVNSFWQGVVDQIYRIVSQQREEAQALQEDLDFFKDSFQALDSALIVVDGRGIIDWANRAAAKVLGIDVERDKGELLINLFRAPAFSRFIKAREFTDPLVVESPRLTGVTLEVQVMPFRSDYLLIMARDISELIKLEHIRQDFVTNVSHELRTPLTVITGYLETLKDNAESLPPTWERVFEQMLAQSHRMDSMVTDLLWLSRLESVPDTEQADKVPIKGLLQGVISDAQVGEPGKTIKLETLESDQRTESGQSICLQGSYDELRSAFSNLVQNAVKYTKPEGVITVAYGFEDNLFCVRVSDDGEGIDPVHIPRLTERFYRTDASRASSTGGTGLGLAIVKHILNRHDAQLDISSTLGKGSRFSCLFPVERVIN